MKEIIFLFIFVLSIAIVNNAHAISQTYTIALDDVTTEGELDEEKFSKHLDIIIEDFTSSHFHTGKIEVKVQIIFDVIILTLNCEHEIKDANYESDYLCEMPKAGRLS
jgi:hypothetical protein